MSIFHKRIAVMLACTFFRWQDFSTDRSSKEAPKAIYYLELSRGTLELVCFLETTGGYAACTSSFSSKQQLIFGGVAVSASVICLADAIDRICKSINKSSDTVENNCNKPKTI